MNLKLRVRHGFTWIILLVVLPFTLALAYAVRPHFKNDLKNDASAIECREVIQSTVYASYYYCSGTLYVKIESRTREPGLQIEIKGRNELDLIVPLSGRRSVATELGIESGSVEVSLVESLRGKVLDQFQFDIE